MPTSRGASKQLALALRNELGLVDGDRVATFAWNHHEHLETYIGAPVGGFVTHTLNLRLHPDDLTYIATHAGDRVLIADKTLWPLVEAFKDRAGFEHVIAIGAGETPPGAIDFEDLLATADAEAFSYRDIDERSAAAMCYTSGTTGQPKGVVYSHRAIVIHSLASTQSSSLGISESDAVLPVVPMFHANAWGFPFTCTLVGSAQVFPGAHLDPVSLLDAFVDREITVTAGVPTIWMGILQALDAEPERWDLSRLRSMIVGGAAAPQAMIEGFERRHGLHITHAWGMTEMAPMGTISALSSRELALPEDEQYRYRAKQGLPSPLVEIRARGGDGLVPWDGATMGELEVRGPWISSSYYNAPEASDRWTDDGWFKTGDIVTIEPNGYVEIQDRSKDLVKSGGEWISTVALENALMGHPAVLEAAVIAVPGREVVGAPARSRRLPRGPDGRRRRAARLPGAELREVVAAGALRDGRRDPEDGGRQVPQDCIERAVRHTAVGAGPVPPDRTAVDRGGSLGTFVTTEHEGAVARVTIDNPPMNALSTALLAELEAEIDRLDGDAATRAVVICGCRRSCLRRGSRHQGVSRAARGRRERGRRGPRAAGGRQADGRCAHPFRRRDQGLLPRRRARARDVLRRPHLRRRRQAGPARDQARPHSRGRWHATTPAARRPGPREPSQPGRRLHRRRDGVPVGPRRARRPAAELLAAATAIGTGFAARSPHAVAVIRELARTTRDLSLEEGLRREADGFRRCLLARTAGKA